MKTKTPTTVMGGLWIVEYTDHDRGSAGGYFIRNNEKEAARSAKLMKECGYQTTGYRLWK